MAAGRAPRPEGRPAAGGLAASLAITLFCSCGAPHPRPIVLNQELCEHCHMTITDPRFAAEFVTRTGKILVFDDVGCLTAYLREAHPAGGTAWVFDFVSPDGVLEADKAVYLQTGTIHTPMAGGLLALRPGREADSVRAALGGDLLPWAAAQMRAGRHSPSPPS